ncbi:conserved hypothetical protein [uncultured Thiomicrorhabdus sp.]
MTKSLTNSDTYMKTKRIDEELLAQYRQQVVEQIIESLRLNFLGIDRMIGLEIDFEKLKTKIEQHISTFHPTMQLGIASELIGHEILEVKAFCYVTKKGQSFANQLFALPVESKNLSVFSQPVFSLVEVAEWINEKLCSKS